MHNDTNVSQKLAVLEGVSVALNQALQQILETLKASKAGEARKELSVHLTIDLPGSLSSADDFTPGCCPINGPK